MAINVFSIQKYNFTTIVCGALIDFTISAPSRSLMHSSLSLPHALSLFRSPKCSLSPLLSLSRQLSPPFLLRRRNSKKRNCTCYLDIATFHLPRCVWRRGARGSKIRWRKAIDRGQAGSWRPEGGMRIHQVRSMNNLLVRKSHFRNKFTLGILFRPLVLLHPHIPLIPLLYTFLQALSSSGLASWDFRADLTFLLNSRLTIKYEKKEKEKGIRWQIYR